MKKLMIIALITGATSTQAIGQQDTVHTLLHIPKVKHVGVYFAPEYQIVKSESDYAQQMGGSFMVLLNNRFAVGIAGLHSMHHDTYTSGSTDYRVQSGVGGLKMEYTLFPTKAVHFTIPLMIGGGYAQMDTTQNEYPYYHHQDGNFRNAARYFVVQPGFQVEANILKWFKLFTGVSYRVAAAVENESAVPTNTLQGFGGQVGIKLGIFNKSWKKTKV